jgi:hypothetical protein
MWSLHTRALRSLTTDIDTFFEMQSKIILQGLLAGDPLVITKTKRAPRAAALRVSAV